MAFHFWTGSAWQTINNSYDPAYGDSGAGFNVWNGSSWLNAVNAKVWNGSTWKGFIDQVQLSEDTAFSYFPFGAVTADWAIYSSGNVSFTGGSPYSWIVNSANVGQYEIVVSQTSGDMLDTSSPLDTAIDLATGGVWRVLANEFNETATATLSATIYHKITGNIVAGNSIYLYASRVNELPI